jgi:hypothetical protein
VPITISYHPVWLIASDGATAKTTFDNIGTWPHLQKPFPSRLGIRRHHLAHEGAHVPKKAK